MNKRLHPLFDDEGAIGAESTSVESSEIAAEQTHETPDETAETTEDVTKQESFAKRLKEQTDKAIAEERTKWEQEGKTNAQAARDALIADEGLRWNGKPITTESDYRQMLREAEIRKEYEDQDLPEEILNEIVEGKKFREKYETKEQQDQAKEKQLSDFKTFFEAYPDLDANTVPQSVWVDYAAGKDLVDSYAKHENASLKLRLAEIEQKQQIEQLNQVNANSSTGSVTGNGATIPTNYTRDQVKAMSEAEVNKNWEAIISSQKTWK